MFELISALVKRILPASVFRRLRLKWWPLVYPLGLDYCPVSLPWFPGARLSTPIAKLHRIATSPTGWQKARWKRASWVTRACVALALVMWPAQVVWRIGSVYVKNRKGIRALYGRSSWQQLIDLFRLALISNVPPFYYYRYRLFDPRLGSRAESYLYPEELTVLYPTLSVKRPSDDVLELKDRFYERGVELGLPVVPCLLRTERGAITWYVTPEVLPAADLMLKPAAEAQGRGIERWRYDAATDRWRHGSRTFDRDGLLAYAAAVASLQPFVLQQCLVNHSELLPLSGVGLSTARFVTYRRPSGDTGVLIACLRMPTGDSPLDNFSAGGISAQIDLRTSTLGVAMAKDPLRGEFTHHPNSGAPIVGAVVPDVERGKDITIQAHHAFPWVPFVGWDVAFTPNGPLLVEANPNWTLDIAQIATRTPLGETIYPEVFLEHLDAQRQQGAGRPRNGPGDPALAIPGSGGRLASRRDDARP